MGFGVAVPERFCFCHFRVGQWARYVIPTETFKHNNKNQSHRHFGGSADQMHTPFHTKNSPLQKSAKII